MKWKEPIIGHLSVLAQQVIIKDKFRFFGRTITLELEARLLPFRLEPCFWSILLLSWKLCWFEFKPVVMQQTRIKNHWKMFFCNNYCVQWLCALRLYSWWKWFDRSHLLKISLKSVIGQRVSKMGKISLSPHKSITSNAPNCKFSFLEQDKWVKICYNSGMYWISP